MALYLGRRIIRIIFCIRLSKGAYFFWGGRGGGGGAYSWNFMAFPLFASQAEGLSHDSKYNMSPVSTTAPNRLKGGKIQAHSTDGCFFFLALSTVLAF